VHFKLFSVIFSTVSLASVAVSPRDSSGTVPLDPAVTSVRQTLSFVAPQQNPVYAPLCTLYRGSSSQKGSEKPRINRAFTCLTRHRASTSMYSLTFCVHFMLPERHQWKPAVQAAAVMLTMPPSMASYRPAACAHPSERSHYVVISRDGRKLVTRVRVMLP